MDFRRELSVPANENALPPAGSALPAKESGIPLGEDANRAKKNGASPIDDVLSLVEDALLAGEYAHPPAGSGLLAKKYGLPSREGRFSSLKVETRRGKLASRDAAVR